MKGKRHTPEQIVRKLREGQRLAGEGQDMAQVCQQLGVSEQTYYRWKERYGGSDADQAKELKTLREENHRLKKAVAELTLDKQILQEALKGK